MRRCSLAAGGSRPHRTPWDGDGSCPAWHVGMGAKQGFCLLPGRTAMTLGCLGVPQGCLVQRAQCSPVVTALLSHWGLGVTWKGQVLCQSHMDPLPTQGEEQDTVTERTGLVLGRRGEFPSSPAFSVAQEFRTGVHSETGRGGSPFQRSHHPHFPSQPPWVARGGGGHPQACVPMKSHGAAACGSGLV